MATILPNGKTQFEDVNGRPLVGGQVFYYQPNTETKIDTWKDIDLTTPNQNPVVLDGRGQAPIWGNTVYRQLVKDRNGLVIWDEIVSAAVSYADLDNGIAANSLKFNGQSLAQIFFARLNRVVDSIAVLRSISSEIYSRVFVSGYYSPHDGGGGAYQLDPIDTTSVDNGGTIVVAADGGRWKLQHTGKVSLKQFGAKGDGTTDDTAAIVSAISSALAIFLPNGSYVMTNTSFTTGMTLEGEDKFNTVILWKANSAEANLFGFASFAGNVAISNLTINSNFQNQTDSTGYYGAIGGSFANGARLTLNEVAFINGRISDINLSGPTGAGQFASVAIRNCLFTNGLVGNATRAAQAVALSEGFAVDFSHNQMIQSTAPASYGRAGLVVQRIPGSTSLSFATVSVKDNYFLNFGLSGSNVLGCVYIYSGAEQVIISGNESKNSYGAAYCVKSDSGNVVIANNSVVNHNDPAVSPIVFFNQAVSYTSSIGVNLIIESNVVTGYMTAGIFVDGGRISLSNFSNIVVADNTCNGGQYGIHYRNVTNCRITGNVIQNTSSEAIFGEAEIGDVSITDNTIASGVVGIDINGSTSSANLEISRNMLTALTGPAIRLRTAVNFFFIDSNTIAGCTTAITTTGAAASSAIRNNNISGETGSWNYSGSYGPLQFEKNIFSVAVPFSQRSLAMDGSGAITAIADWHYVDTNGGASSGNLVTINGAYDGRRLTLFCASSARIVTLVPDTGNLKLNGNFALSSGAYCITLMARGGVWYEQSRSANT